MKNTTLKADKLVRDLCKSLSGNRCANCGSRYNIAAHHIIHRGNKSVRWDLDNLVCLCAKCHRLIHDGLNEDFADRGVFNKYDVSKFYRELKGDFKYQSMMEKSIKPFKELYPGGVEQVIEELKQIKLIED